MDAAGYEWPSHIRRASVTLRPDDPFIIALDPVRVDECRMYLAARGDRRSYLDMGTWLRGALRDQGQTRWPSAVEHNATLATRDVRAKATDERIGARTPLSQGDPDCLRFVSTPAQEF